MTLLNLLISIIGDVYGQISAQEERTQIYQWVSIVAEMDKAETEANIIKEQKKMRAFLIAFMQDRELISTIDE